MRSLAQGGDTILKPADTQKLLPASVYYKAQSAPTQLRNSAGIKFADGFYLLATLVDTSGYSSDVAAKYQAYFITEVPMKIGGENLPAGIYGVGFIGGKFVVTDVGAHDVFSVDRRGRGAEAADAAADHGRSLGRLPAVCGAQVGEVCPIASRHSVVSSNAGLRARVFALHQDLKSHLF